MSLDVVSRKEWMALPPRAIHLYVKTFKRVFVMNSHSKPCSDELYCMGGLRLLQRIHMDKQNHVDIRYNFIIGGDGNIYEGRGWHAAPLMPRMYTKTQNTNLLVCFMGEHSMETLPGPMDLAARRLIKYGVSRGHIEPNYLFYDIMARYENLRCIGRHI